MPIGIIVDILHRRFNCELTAVLHGIPCIDGEINEDLLKLSSVSHDR